MKNDTYTHRAKKLRNLAKIYPDSKSAQKMEALAKQFEILDKANHGKHPPDFA